MQTQLPEVSNIRQLKEGYACRVNGGPERSAFIEGMDGENGRIYEAIIKAIDAGAYVTPYVAPPAPGPRLIELAELDKSMPRGTEDLYDALITKGVITESDMNPYAVAKIKRKKELRV